MELFTNFKFKPGDVIILKDSWKQLEIFGRRMAESTESTSVFRQYICFREDASIFEADASYVERNFELKENEDD